MKWAGITWAAMLALILAGGMVGCGGSGDKDEDTTTDTEPADTTTDLSDVIPDPTTEPPEDMPDSTTDTPPDGDCTAMGTTGAACTMASDCCGVPVGYDCMTDLFSGYITFPGGYCSSQACTSNADCGPDAECLDVMGFIQFCLRTCTDSSECRESEGYSCSELPYIGGGPYCIPTIELPDMPPDGYTDVYPDIPGDGTGD
jgi:hypothetical protein